MQIDGQSILAVCYFKKDGDNNNACFVSNESLFVKQKKHFSNFPLEIIQDITLQHKFILLPLVIGGIIAPLSLHALLNHLYSPWLLYSLLILGGSLFYLGWEGSHTFTVKTHVKEYDFFIKKPSANLIAFTQYVKKFQSDQEMFNVFYFICPIEEWRLAKEKGLLKITQPTRLYNSSERFGLTLSAKDKLLSIRPTEHRINISFQEDHNKNNRIPVITSNIPTQYIEEV